MEKRTSNYPIMPMILNRWSPRSMTGEVITEEELRTLFEAARWAPSSYNNQPWRFIYAKKGTAEFEKLFSLLVEFNQMWCKNASHLIVIISRKKMEHNDNPNPTHSFDAGSAWENLALQAEHMSIVAHAMAGFDYERASAELEIPDMFHVEAMVAIGKKAPKENLPASLQEGESLSDRKPLNEIIMEGKFKA